MIRINIGRKSGWPAATGLLAAFTAIALLSYAALYFPPLSAAIFIFLALAALILSFYNLEYGLLFVLAELFIGSMGHLFVLSVGSFSLPIRIAVWSALLIAFAFRFLVQLARSGRKSAYLRAFKEFSYKRGFALLGLFIAIGILNGLIQGHAFGLIFSDANAWLYILLIFPAAAVYGGHDEAKERRLRFLFLISALWVSLETLVLLAIFKHQLPCALDVYTWMRKTLVGEMTPTLSGWPRVFIQGQVFAGAAFFILLGERFARPALRRRPKNIRHFLLAAFFASSLLISFSRSFWVGLLAAGFLSLIVLWRRYSWRRALGAAAWGLGAFAVAYLLIYLVATISFSGPSGSFDADFVDRVSDQNGAAISSRWSLLPVLGREVMKEPVFGQGYGATVTYYSQDPRVLQNNPTGRYTTYAFEWGYLDIALKLGLLGLAAYLWLLIGLIVAGLKKGREGAAVGISAALVFLMATHFFTPFLNHPLGIGLVVLGACLIRKERVY